MIGVVADPLNREVVKEFFELFKTPWEFYEKGHDYDVLLCSGNAECTSQPARLTLVYSSDTNEWDIANQSKIGTRTQQTTLNCCKSILPIYGSCLLFQGTVGVSKLSHELTGQSALSSCSSLNRQSIRIGYDLFDEIRYLLTHGQPVEYAGIPTLELHISLLRDLIVLGGVTVTEIPAVPKGYKFIVCLTHDVDHPSMRKHRWDRTVAGFLYRATAGSFLNFLKRSISLTELMVNWAAALRLPLVHMGLSKDLWRDFVDRYRELEEGLCSTFFIIPFQGRPGRDLAGMAPSYRAAHYGADEIADSIAEIAATGGEVGLHGIDAWIDAAKGKKEVEKIRELTGQVSIGSRMHWLFFNENSPVLLEEAGVSYDSTIGYRETVGFWAGTTQAYKPIQAERILELPLHVMDTALFYPAYLGLSSRDATTLLVTMADLAEQFGGCLTVNWHDRSLSPERQWGKCYSRLLDDLKARGAWFATTGQAVAWFRRRRSVVMTATNSADLTFSNDDCCTDHDCLPRLQVRTYSPPARPQPDTMWKIC